MGVVASGRPERELIATEHVVRRHMDYDDVATELRNETSSLEVFAG